MYLACPRVEQASLPNFEELGARLYGQARNLSSDVALFRLNSLNFLFVPAPQSVDLPDWIW